MLSKNSAYNPAFAGNVPILNVHQQCLLRQRTNYLPLKVSCNILPNEKCTYTKFKGPLTTLHSATVSFPSKGQLSAKGKRYLHQSLFHSFIQIVEWYFSCLAFFNESSDYTDLLGLAVVAGIPGSGVFVGMHGSANGMRKTRRRSEMLHRFIIRLRILCSLHVWASGKYTLKTG